MSPDSLRRTGRICCAVDTCFFFSRKGSWKHILEKHKRFRPDRRRRFVIGIYNNNNNIVPCNIIATSEGSSGSNAAGFESVVVAAAAFVRISIITPVLARAPYSRRSRPVRRYVVVRLTATSSRFECRYYHIFFIFFRADIIIFFKFFFRAEIIIFFKFFSSRYYLFFFIFFRRRCFFFCLRPINT